MKGALSEIQIQTYSHTCLVWKNMFRRCESAVSVVLSAWDGKFNCRCGSISSSAVLLASYEHYYWSVKTLCWSSTESKRTPEKDQGRKTATETYSTLVFLKIHLFQESSQRGSPSYRRRSGVPGGGKCLLDISLKHSCSTDVWARIQTPTNTHLASPQLCTPFPWTNRELRHKADAGLIKD